MKDSKIEKLLVGIWKAFDLLRGSLHTPEAFKIVLALLYYKRINDILEKTDEFEYFEPNDVSAECLLPEENRWHHLLNTPPHQIFLQISRNISEIACLNKIGSINLEGIEEALSFQTYQAKIPYPIQQLLVNLFNSQDLSFREISYIKFQEVVMMLESKCRNNSESYIHPSLNKLMMGILCPGFEENVYIPLCSFGEATNLLIDHIYNDEYIINESGNYGIELNVHDLEILALIKLRLSVAIISNAKSMKEHKRKRIKPLTIYNFDEKMKADVIFLNPPFGLHHPEHLPSKVDIDGNSLKISRNNGELFELLKHVQKLSENGRMGVVMPYGVLFRSGHVRNIWKFLVESDYLEAVIQLPQKIFPQTSIVTAILIINKSKPKTRKHKTLFAKVESSLVGDTVTISNDEINRVVNTFNKANGDIESIVTLEEIQQQDYNLSPDKYIGSLPKEIEELLQTHAGKHLVELCDVSRYRSRRPDQDDSNGLPFIKTKDLEKDVIDLYLNYDNCFLGLPQANDNVLDKKCILVSLIGNTLKPTIFDPETAYKGEPDHNGDYYETYPGILLGNDIAAIIPNEQIVDFEYMYYQLYSPMVKRQIETLLIGAGGVPRIILQDFKKFVIPILESLEAQRAYAKQQKLLLFEAENIKFEAVKARLDIPEKKQAAEYEIVRHLAHDIKPKINIVGAPLRTISDFLNNEGLLDNGVSVRLDGTKATARETINIALEGLDQITNVLDSARDIVTREIKRDDFQKIIIDDLFENKIIPQYENESYRIIVDCKDKELEVYLHVESFIEAINNIIRNAETHAFSDDIADPELRFEINEDVKEEKVVIDYTNNGYPLPIGMSKAEFLSFGKKSIHSKGEGLGGAWIGKVVEAHEGSFEIILDDNPVHFRFKFPKEVK